MNAVDRTIEPFGDDGWIVVEHGEYERGSVLEGQPRRAFVEAYETLEAAQRDYPRAEVLEWSTRVGGGAGGAGELGAGMGPGAPDWFDAADAGEEW